MTGCECSSPGKCVRHNEVKVPRSYWLCKYDQRYFDLFERLAEERKSRGQLIDLDSLYVKDLESSHKTVTRMNDPCIHRSDNPVEKGSCGSCPKTWRYQCSHPSIDRLVVIQDCGSCPLYE